MSEINQIAIATRLLLELNGARPDFDTGDEISWKEDYAVIPSTIHPEDIEMLVSMGWIGEPSNGQVTFLPKGLDEVCRLQQSEKHIEPEVGYMVLGGNMDPNPILNHFWADNKRPYVVIYLEGDPEDIMCDPQLVARFYSNVVDAENDPLISSFMKLSKEPNLIIDLREEGFATENILSRLHNIQSPMPWIRGVSLGA